MSNVITVVRFNMNQFGPCCLPVHVIELIKLIKILKIKGLIFSILRTQYFGIKEKLMVFQNGNLCMSCNCQL